MVLAHLIILQVRISIIFAAAYSVRKVNATELRFSIKL